MLSLVQYTFWIIVLVADIKNSWTFSWSSGEISLSTELQRISNSTAISLHIYFCLQNIVLSHVPKVKYQLIARIISFLSVLCCNHNLFALIGDCTFSCFLLITETCYLFLVSLKQSYSKVYKVIWNFLSVYNDHVLLLIKIKLFMSM